MLSLSAHQHVLGRELCCRQHGAHFIIPQSAALATKLHVVAFVTVTEDKEDQLTVSELLDVAGVVTLKERVMETAAFKQFQQAVENKVGPKARNSGQ